MTPEAFDILGLALGAVLTLLVLFYLLDAKPFHSLYRLALHLFVGTLVGYSFGIVIREVVLKMAMAQLSENLILIVPLAMGLWLFFFKGIPRLAYVGNFVLAYLIGVGAAVALSGALLGTLIPQIAATGHALSLGSLDPWRFVNGLLVVVGTICTLMAFNFLTAREQRGLAGTWAQIVGLIARVGRVFLLFAYGVAFAGALTASLSIFIGRIQYLVDVFTDIYFYVAGG